MLQITESFGGDAVMLRERGAGRAGTWHREVGREGTGENWQSIGTLAGAAIQQLRTKMIELNALTAFVEGRVYADAYRQLVMLVLAREPHLKGTIQEIEAEALARVSTLSAMPLEGADKITEIMDRVRSNVAASWSGSARNVAPRASESSALAGQNVAPRRRGRNPLAAE